MATNNGYKVVVRYCPNDRELGYPRFKSLATFVGTNFMESLYGGVFPRYMIVEFVGPPFHAPDADRTLWTVGPHPTREGRQALYEYEGERVLASKPRKPSTLIDITDEVIDATDETEETRDYVFMVEIIVESDSEENANSALRNILSDYEMADGILIDWDVIEEET